MSSYKWSGCASKSCPRIVRMQKDQSEKSDACMIDSLMVRITGLLFIFCLFSSIQYFINLFIVVTPSSLFAHNRQQVIDCFLTV